MCLHLVAAPSGVAQWLPDRAYTEGPGIRVGDLELHPGVAVRGGYDTNVFRTPGTLSNPEVDSAILAVTPHLHLSTLGRQRLSGGENAAGAAAAPLPPPVAFDFGVAATYFHYFEESAPKNAEVDLDGSLSVLPDRKFGFDVGATYGRFTRPFTAQVGSSNNSYAYDRIRPSLTLRGQSSGGVLKGRVGFAPTFNIYEGRAFRYLEQYQYEVPVGLAWKFLPNTALLYDGSYSFNDYRRPQEERASIFLSDSHRLQSRVGINGAVTPRFAVRALVGYAVVLQKQFLLDDREDAVGEAALIYSWSFKDSVEAGYQRMLEVANLGGWTQLDRGYLKSRNLFGGLFALNLEAGVAHVNYGRLLAPTSTPDMEVALGVGGETHRDDIRIDGGVHAEVRATNWLAFTADFSVLATLTDFRYARDAAPVYPGEFKTFQVFGGVRAHY
jgi:hypothetical protein